MPRDIADERRKLGFLDALFKASASASGPDVKSGFSPYSKRAGEALDLEAKQLEKPKLSASKDPIGLARADALYPSLPENVRKKYSVEQIAQLPDSDVKFISTLNKPSSPRPVAEGVITNPETGRLELKSKAISRLKSQEGGQAQQIPASYTQTGGLMQKANIQEPEQAPSGALEDMTQEQVTKQKTALWSQPKPQGMLKKDWDELKKMQVKDLQYAYDKAKSDVKAVTKTLNEAGVKNVQPVLSQINSLLPDGIYGDMDKEVPGFGPIESKIPGSILRGAGELGEKYLGMKGSKERGQIASQLKKAHKELQEVIIRARSGAAVTPQERNELLDILGGGMFDTDRDFREGIQAFTKRFNQILNNHLAGFSDNVKNKYLYRGGTLAQDPGTSNADPLRKVVDDVKSGKTEMKPRAKKSWKELVKPQADPSTGGA